MSYSMQLKGKIERNHEIEMHFDSFVSLFFPLFFSFDTQNDINERSASVKSRREK